MIQLSQQAAGSIQVSANVILAIFTMVLAIATVVYAIESKKQVEAQSRPFIKPAATIEKGGINHFVIENIGNGTAHNVETKWWIENLDDSMRSFHAPIFHPGDRANFDFPIDDEGDPLLNKDQLESAFDNLGIEGVMIIETEFEDSLGNTWSPETERINIVKQLTKRYNPDIFYLDDMDNAIV